MQGTHMGLPRRSTGSVAPSRPRCYGNLGVGPEVRADMEVEAHGVLGVFGVFGVFGVLGVLLSVDVLCTNFHRIQQVTHPDCRQTHIRHSNSKVDAVYILWSAGVAESARRLCLV